MLNSTGTAHLTLGEHLKSHKALKEHIEDQQNRSKAIDSVNGSPDKTIQEKKWSRRSWQQRKVLELLLFHTMLDELYNDTQNIFECIEREFFQSRNPSRADLNEQQRAFTATQSGGRIIDSISETGKSDGANSLAKAVYYQSQLHEQVTGDNYYAIIREWRQFEQILAANEENLNENLERIYQWNRREEDRKSDKPRWSRKDEIFYHAEINKLTAANRAKISDIERLVGRIKSFRESLSSRMESIRGDINFTGSQNIQLFTYVTVVFLPLGFATGIFSTNGPPTLSTIQGLYKVALIAFSLTVFVLINAKVGRLVVSPVITVCRWIGDWILFALVRPVYGTFAFAYQLIKYIIFHTCMRPFIWAFYKWRKTPQPLSKVPNDLESQEKETKKARQDSLPLWKQTYMDISQFSLRRTVETESEEAKKPKGTKARG